MYFISITIQWNIVPIYMWENWDLEIINKPENWKLFIRVCGRILNEDVWLQISNRWCWSPSLTFVQWRALGSWVALRNTKYKRQQTVLTWCFYQYCGVQRRMKDRKLEKSAASVGGHQGVQRIRRNPGIQQARVRSQSLTSCLISLSSLSLWTHLSNML